MTSNSEVHLSSEITIVPLEEEMKRSYLDYAMSVIVSRALPDIRDGLKPVHRRILYAMKESGNTHEKSYKKSANSVGYVMMKYHPHGDSPIYEAMVRMVQDFSMRLPLVDGQGNFGSMDGDSAAAYRYTEARLSKAAHSLLADIDQDTVDFRPNFDGTDLEPTVLPARYPNLLVNGAGGIAVGMATNIPPHNLGEVVDACCAYIHNPDITLEEIMGYIQGPDFPTGGIILGRTGIYEAAKTGRGSVIMRGRTHFEEIRKDRQAIIVTEVPYQVNKARMIERMAEVVKLKLIDGISDLRDESDRDGVRMVIELKREANPEVVLNQLYRYTPLQSTFSVNTLALDKGQPKSLSVRDIIKAFIEFRDEVITRRIKFELRKARDRAHILLGLAVAVANLDDMIQLIKNAADPQVAREQILAHNWPAHDIAPLINLVEESRLKIFDGVQQQATYRLSEAQARAILDLRLHRLTGLERHKIDDELQHIIEQIKEYLSILGSREKLYDIMQSELLEVKEKFATPRRTTIEEADGSVEIEDLIQVEEMVITVSQNGYIKRVPLATYRAQKRGGKGRSGMSMREEDFVKDVFVADTHTPVLFFSSKGIAYLMKVYRLPIGTPQTLGKAMINLLPLAQDETISAVLPLPKDQSEVEKMSIVFATSHGTVRRNNLSDFLNVRANGKIAMKLDEGETLMGVVKCTDDHDILLSTREGKSVRFSLLDLRVFASRVSTGVRGIKLAKGDEMIAITVLNHTQTLPEERYAYIKLSRQKRDLEEDLEEEIEQIEESEEGINELSSANTLSAERFNELEAQEQFILTVTDRGFGKRSSAFEYRITNRGVQGFASMKLTAKTGKIINSFVVGDNDQIVLVTDGGQLIRCPVKHIRVAGRQTQGVTIFRVSDGEKVVSIARIADAQSDEDDIESEDLPLENDIDQGPEITQADQV
ncbi:MAG: DNA gyrase subunit A [Janthinobacterium lividum]